MCSNWPRWAAAALIIGGQGGCRAPKRPAKPTEGFTRHVGEGRLKVRLVDGGEAHQVGSGGSSIVRSRQGSGGTNKEQGHKNAVRAIRLRCAPDCSLFKRTQVC